MNLALFFGKVFLLYFTLIFFSSISSAQSKKYQEDGDKMEYTKLSGFSDDERTKLLLLNLLPSGMTETAAEEIGKALQLNIHNTNHFTVVAPAEWNMEIREQNPSLSDCHDIACGTMIGKLFDADKVLVGNLHSESILNENGEEESSFVLSVRMVDTQTNKTDFKDDVQFTDIKMHDELFRLAARISENTLLVGNVMKTEPSGITLSLGRAQGIRTGQKLVISRIASLKERQITNQSKKYFQKIALAEIVQISDLSSNAVVVQKIFPVVQGDQVQTYIDKEKLINLISQTRRELDTQKRLQPKKRTILKEPDTGKVNTEYSKWSYRYRQLKEQHDRWFFSSVLTGGATILLLSGVINLSGVLTAVPWLTGAGTVYTGIRYLHYRDLMDEIITEGRSDGFISSKFILHPPGWELKPISSGFRLNWIKRF